MSEKSCIVEDCENVPRTKELCSKHYQRLQRTGSPMGREGWEKKTCAHEGCDREARSKGLCHNHYQQSRRDAAPKTPRETKEKPPCTVEGCSKPRHGAEHCQMHYRRLKNNGAVDVVRTGGRTGKKWTPEERALRAESKKAREEGRAPQRQLSEITSWRGAHERAKDACVHGHAYTDENTYITPQGTRACRICRNISRVKSSYGVSREWLDEKMAEQSNACAVCRRSFTEVTACVDHNHRTGEALSLLCSSCNLAEGHMRQNHEAIQRLAEYVLVHYPPTV